MTFRVPRVLFDPKARAVTPRLGEGRPAPGGVLDHGTQEEDGPGTWEALVFLDTSRSHGESGDPFSDALAHADRALAVKKSGRSEVGGGLHTSVDVGERGGARTRLSEGGPCGCELQEGTMTNASTLGSMSPGLLKVVERARSEGRCDRAGAGGGGRG